MRYLTGDALSQFDLEEAVVWEQLRGFGQFDPSDTEYYGPPPTTSTPTPVPYRPTWKAPVIVKKPAATVVKSPVYEYPVQMPYRLPTAKPLVTKAPTPVRRAPTYVQAAPLVPKVYGTDCASLLDKRCDLVKQFAAIEQRAAQILAGKSPGQVSEELSRELHSDASKQAQLKKQIELLDYDLGKCKQAEIQAGLAKCKGFAGQGLVSGYAFIKDIAGNLPGGAAVPVPPTPPQMTEKDYAETVKQVYHSAQGVSEAEKNIQYYQSKLQAAKEAQNEERIKDLTGRIEDLTELLAGRRWARDEAYGALKRAGEARSLDAVVAQVKAVRAEAAAKDIQFKMGWAPTPAELMQRAGTAIKDVAANFDFFSGKR